MSSRMTGSNVKLGLGEIIDIELIQADATTLALLHLPQVTALLGFKGGKVDFQIAAGRRIPEPTRPDVMGLLAIRQIIGEHLEEQLFGLGGHPPIRVAAVGWLQAQE